MREFCKMQDRVVLTTDHNDLHAHIELCIAFHSISESFLQDMQAGTHVAAAMVTPQGRETCSFCQQPSPIESMVSCTENHVLHLQ